MVTLRTAPSDDRENVAWFAFSAATFEPWRAYQAALSEAARVLAHDLRGGQRLCGPAWARYITAVSAAGTKYCTATRWEWETLTSTIDAVRRGAR